MAGVKTFKLLVINKIKLNYITDDKTAFLSKFERDYIIDIQVVPVKKWRVSPECFLFCISLR